MGCGRNFESSSSSSSSHGFPKKEKDNCICDVVRAIKDIQDSVVNNDCPGCPTNCFLEPLGGLVSPSRHTPDTRVFMLLAKDGTPFKAFFHESNNHHNNHHDGKHDTNGQEGKKRRSDSCFSVFFRVEDIFDGCCATLRVLEPLDRHGKEVDILNKDGDKIDFRKICEVEEFLLSDSCVTVDLDCFCGIECVADTFLGVCD